MGETIDLHCHMVAYKPPNIVSLQQIEQFNKDGFGFFSDSSFTLDSQRDFQKGYIDELAELVRQSNHIDKVVLLAMDKPYDGGEVHYYVDDEWLLQQLRGYPELLFGASINPARRGAVEVLKHFSFEGAVLNKILPNSMRVDLSDKRYDKFFETMVDLNMLLLVHSGDESAILGCDQKLGNPEKLRRVADIGIKMVISHCGTPEYLAEFLDLVQKYDNVYGGLAAMVRKKRFDYLVKLVKIKDIHHKLVFETDYPLVPHLELLQKILQKNFRGSRFQTNNILDCYKQIFSELGFPETIFYKGAELLNLS